MESGGAIPDVAELLPLIGTGSGIGEDPGLLKNFWNIASMAPFASMPPAPLDPAVLCARADVPAGSGRGCGGTDSGC